MIKTEHKATIKAILSIIIGIRTQNDLDFEEFLTLQGVYLELKKLSEPLEGEEINEIHRIDIHNKTRPLPPDYGKEDERLNIIDFKEFPE